MYVIQKVIGVKISTMTTEKNFTFKECKDIVNQKEYLVKCQYSCMQFLGLCFEVQKLISVTKNYPSKLLKKKHTCKECVAGMNMKEYRTKYSTV